MRSCPLYPNGETDNVYYTAAKDKPSPLTAQFDAAYFDGIVRSAKPTLSMKALFAAGQSSERHTWAAMFMTARFASRSAGIEIAGCFCYNSI
jgi:hypothetical protein